jgi:hypothetical protein
MLLQQLQQLHWHLQTMVHHLPQLLGHKQKMLLQKLQQLH